ncbi:hypothetical protein NL676_027327 [Syzygium grande]|nr:hypothetical protein NL676_027327 [Syzygium grande]
MDLLCNAYSIPPTKNPNPNVHPHLPSTLLLRSDPDPKIIESPSPNLIPRILLRPELLFMADMCPKGSEPSWVWVHHPLWFLTQKTLTLQLQLLPLVNTIALSRAFHFPLFFGYVFVIVFVSG